MQNNAKDQVRLQVLVGRTWTPVPGPVKRILLLRHVGSRERCCMPGVLQLLNASSAVQAGDLGKVMLR